MDRPQDGIVYGCGNDPRRRTGAGSPHHLWHLLIGDSITGCLRWAGAAYLVWLGSKLLLSRPAHLEIAKIKDVGPLAAAREGMLANLLNPWPITFMIAFLPQFVDPQGSVTLQLLLLGVTQKMTGVLVLAAYAVAAGAAGLWIMRRPRVRLWQQRIAGCLIVGLGVRMAIGGANR